MQQASYTLGPTLPAEAGKPPWRPKTAGRIAFFLGPFAGALIVTMSLRRMGQPQAARKAMLFALGLATIMGVILFFVPDAVGRVVGLGVEAASLLFFPGLMEKEFIAWQAAHPASTPANGWLAIGWGLIGAPMLFVVLFLVFLPLMLLFPGR